MAVNVEHQLVAHQWQRWLGTALRRLTHYVPDVHNRRFWAVQALVLAVAAIHDFIEATGLMNIGDHQGYSLAFAPVALFLVPVGYAALNFGFAGSVATAAWCTVLAAPNFLIFHTGAERIAELVQIGIVDLIALFVGQRVDHEVAARRHAESAVAALQLSEHKYRSLFESSPLPVLIVDQKGSALEANSAAAVLLGRRQDSPAAFLELPTLRNAMPAATQGGTAESSLLVLRRPNGEPCYLAPTVTELDDGLIQVILADVTHERRRQAGLRAYAAHVLRAQEDERKRIARELHDEIVQRVVLLCRQLDKAENDVLPDSTRGALARAREASEGIAQDLRNFARALRPPILDDLGLVASMRRLLGELAERCALQTELAIEGVERRLDANVELALYRIGQEALRNVERHSAGRHVKLSIEFSGEAITLQVADDGIGFPRPADTDFAAGQKLGLLGMQERAECLGGHLEIESGPAGTVVRVMIPTANR